MHLSGAEQRAKITFLDLLTHRNHFLALGIFPVLSEESLLSPCVYSCPIRSSVTMSHPGAAAVAWHLRASEKKTAESWGEIVLELNSKKSSKAGNWLGWVLCCSCFGCIFRFCTWIFACCQMTKIIGNVESWLSALWNSTERGFGSAKQQLLQTGRILSGKGWRQLQLSSFCRFISSGVEQFCPSAWFVISATQSEGFCLSPAPLDQQFLFVPWRDF